MRKTGLYGLAMLLSVLSGCVDKDILHVSDNMQVHSSYSLPIGNYITDINSYLESLDTNDLSFAGDSLYYDSVMYPISNIYYPFSLSDSVNFNLVDNPGDKIKSVEFVLIIANGYPTQAEVQVYFMAGTVPVDSAFASGPKIIQPAPVNDDGIVTDPSTTMLIVPMPGDFSGKLDGITHVAVKGKIWLVSPDRVPVKFLPEYKFNLHIGARIELLYNTNEL
jgi:hypothetical protein